MEAEEGVGRGGQGAVAVAVLAALVIVGKKAAVIVEEYSRGRHSASMITAAATAVV